MQEVEEGTKMAEDGRKRWRMKNEEWQKKEGREAGWEWRSRTAEDEREAVGGWGGKC